MPLYVHEVEAQVVPEGGAGGQQALDATQFRALVQAVASELQRREAEARARQSETAITGRNRPPGIGS